MKAKRLWKPLSNYISSGVGGLLCLISLLSPVEGKALTSIPLPSYVSEKARHCLFLLPKVIDMGALSPSSIKEVRLLSERFVVGSLHSFYSQQLIASPSQVDATGPEVIIRFEECHQDLIDYAYGFSEQNISFGCGVDWPDPPKSWLRSDFAFYKNLMAKILDSHQGYETSGRPTPILEMSAYSTAK